MMDVEQLGLRMSLGAKVAPGDKLASANRLQPGVGCYRRGNYIYASAVGAVTVAKRGLEPGAESHNEEESPHVISITLEEGRIYASSQTLTTGSKVLCKVGRIMNQQATVDIIAAEEIGALREHHGGLIRKEDVRLGASEEVKMHESFRPGDVVLARIISLGDSRRFFLSTAENELGVIRAICASSGSVMQPVSWKEMECPDTKVRERRKCAKPKDS